MLLLLGSSARVIFASGNAFFIEINYFYVIYLEDAAGNYSYHPLSFNKQLLKNIPLISFSQNKEDSNIVDITFKIEKEQKCRNYQIQYSIYNEDNSQEGFVLCSDITENKYDSNVKKRNYS